MSLTLPHPQADSDEQQVVLEGVSWDTYVALNDSIGERKNPRMIYCDGRLTLLTRSLRGHELRVPEVWTYEPTAEEVDFWVTRDDGTYDRSGRGLAFPVLTAPDVVGQMRLADQLGAGAWHKRLPAWVRATMVPRQ